jgi:hypothetical protein
MKAKLVNIGLLLGASVFALLLCELGCRLFLNPADYLSQDPVPDKILGAVLTQHGSGYDAWGFRNRKVPSSVDIVAIGDSHTFGNTAKMDESWPYVLGRVTGRSVYNMALGGYGPNQYDYLLKTKALSLKPKLIVCGLYMGDDFENAYRITYGLDYWSYLREHPAEKVDFDIWEHDADPTWHKQIRVWLSRHSVVYKLVFHGSLLGGLKGDVQIENASRLYDGATTLIVRDKNIREAFLPTGILNRVDQTNPGVQEGTRITFKLLHEMNRICRANNIGFVVAVIPTKETVFADYLERDKTLPLSDVMDKVISNERIARQKLFQFFNESDIHYVDTLSALTQSVEHELYARTAQDIHPNKNGYKVIAEAIAADVQNQRRTAGDSPARIPVSPQSH